MFFSDAKVGMLVKDNNNKIGIIVKLYWEWKYAMVCVFMDGKVQYLDELKLSEVGG